MEVGKGGLHSGTQLGDLSVVLQQSVALARLGQVALQQYEMCALSGSQSERCQPQ